jgi:hypothetical protein
VEALADILGNYGLYLNNALVRAQANHDKDLAAKLDNISENVILHQYRAPKILYDQKYYSILKVLQETPKYQPIDLYPHLPMGTGARARMQRMRYLASFQIPFPVAICRLPTTKAGQPPMSFTWATDYVGKPLPEERGGDGIKLTTMDDVINANAIVRDKLIREVPIYASRAMLSRFREKVGNLGRFSPSLLNYLYHEATGMILTPEHGRRDR